MAEEVTRREKVTSEGRVSVKVTTDEEKYLQMIGQIGNRRDIPVRKLGDSSPSSKVIS